MSSGRTSQVHTNTKHHQTEICMNMDGLTIEGASIRESACNLHDIGQPITGKVKDTVVIQSGYRKDKAHMIDCHSHLADALFKEDVDEVIEKAKAAGVKHAVVLPEGYFQFKDVLELYERHPEFVLPGLGVHPVQMSESGNFDRSALVSDWTNEVTNTILTNREKLYCVGECGLDFTPYYIKSATDKDEQKQILKYQSDLAAQLDLPLNVHSRSAGKHVISLLAEAGAKKVLLHAFDAKVSTALQGVELGYYFSIPPSVVRSPQKQKLVDKIPISNLLLETDSPALGPEKQGRNEPSNINVSCDFIAKAKGLTREEVIQITTNNAKNLFTRLAT